MAASNLKLNQFLDDLDQKILECSICLKRLKEPKSLNCLHSFCKECLQGWVQTKGSLSCPSCLRAYPIPEGGIHNLPPNTFLNNLLEIVEQVEEGEAVDCFCGNNQKTKYYCIECRLYLCTPCKDYHVKFPGFAKHKLHLKENISAMTPQQLAALHPPRCPQHNESLKFFCTRCKIPTCMHCAITDHNVVKGKHKLINISEAFITFGEIADKLRKDVVIQKKTSEECLKRVLNKASLLDESKNTSLKDIKNCVEAVVKNIKNKEEKLKKEVERIYEEKRKVANRQTNELNSLLSELSTKLKLMDQLLNCDEATAMKSSNDVIKALNECMQELQVIESEDYGQIYFYNNKANIQTVQQCEIGIVGTEKRAVDKPNKFKKLTWHNFDIKKPPEGLYSDREKDDVQFEEEQFWCEKQEPYLLEGKVRKARGKKYIQK